MKRRIVAADSSSIILLQKCGLLHCFLHNYDVVIAVEVFHELTSQWKKGADILHETMKSLIVDGEKSLAPTGMDQGESATIGLYYQGVADFILLDDKRGANYCRAESIPFINSLLVPRLLYNAGHIHRAERERSTTILSQQGYYSQSIINRARSISDQALERFEPFPVKIERSG